MNKLILGVSLLAIIASSSLNSTNSIFVNHSRPKLSPEYKLSINTSTKSILNEPLLKIIQTLLNYSEQSGSQSIKWKKILNAPDSPLVSDQYYSGLFSGVAGIRLFFLKLYEYTRNITYLEIAEKPANYVLSQEKTINFTMYWQRSAYDLSDSYFSQKYGSAGIVQFLIALYKETKITIYLRNAEIALNSLIDHYITNTSIGKSWRYSYLGFIPLTGLTYGISGISSAFLDLYNATNNNTYLSHTYI